MSYNRPLDKYGFEDTRYPASWSKLRFYIYKRDNYTCQHCGRTCLTKPHCHHVRPLGGGGTNHSSNLITLCERCHSEIHERRR